MKHIALSLLSITLFSSCQTPEQNARLAAIVDTALIIAARRGAITEQDAADVREAGKVILTPDPATTIVVEPAK